MSNPSDLNNFQVRAHFWLKEFQCACCGHVKISCELVRALEELRAQLGGKPIIVTSGLRCVSHNRAVGGAPDSDHLHGWAADIIVDGMMPDEIARIAAHVPSIVRILTYSDKACVHIGIEHRENCPDRFHFTPLTPRERLRNEE